MTWRTLRTISHSLMVHVRVSEAYINFAFMFMEGHIFPVLPIKDHINEDDEPTAPFKLATCMKPSVSHLRVLFFPCVVRKATAHVGTKVFNMCHRAQHCFCGIFVLITQHQNGYTVYIPHRQKIIFSYYIVFYESFSSALAYTS